mgnify:CR=1 FL=1
MKEKFKQAYMDVAGRFAQLSTAERLQVGAIVVKDDRIISIGYNGMPSGWDNICEDTVEEDNVTRLVTKTEVLHAETNAISKLARSVESGEGATIFITHSPCMDCAKMIYQAGITEVYYNEEYRSAGGIEFLKKCGLKVEKIG